MNKKMFRIQTKAIKVDDEKQIVYGVVGSTGIIDRQGESLNPNGWVLDNYLKNPVVLYAHDYKDFPIGKALDVWVENGKLKFNIQLADTDRGKEAFKLIKGGYLNAVSVGFIPLEYDSDGKYTYSKQELLELSVVPVPANPEALMKIKSFEKKFIKGRKVGRKEKNMSKKQDVKDKKEKGVVPYKKYPLDDKSAWDGAKARKQLAKWASSDGSGDKDKIDWGKYAKGFAWFDSENKETFGAYLLPHHYVRDNGLTTVWSGVRAAMASLLGARGGANIPEADRKGVYNHLAKHYKEFDKEPPEFKEYSEKELIKIFGEELVVGKKKKKVKYVKVRADKLEKYLAEAVEKVLVKMIKENKKEKEEKKKEKEKKELKGGDSEIVKRVSDLRDSLRASDKSIGLLLRDLNKIFES